MTDILTNPDLPPLLEVLKQDNGRQYVKLTGNWNLRSLSAAPDLQRKISLIGANKAYQWDMLSVAILDSAAALMLWQAWREQMPAVLLVKPEHQSLLERWQAQTVPAAEPTASRFSLFFNYFHQMIWSFWVQLLDLVTLSGQLVLDFGYLLSHPGDIPRAEISITIYDAGVRALGITALVGLVDRHSAQLSVSIAIKNFRRGNLYY